MATMTLTDWIGRSRTSTDAMAPWPARALIATLDLQRPEPQPGAPLPPFWHWMYFLEAVPRRELGPDGHPAAGGFMPPVRQPRRMWAGGRLDFTAAPLPLGKPATRRSTITRIAAKKGRSGALTFVTVKHEISGASGRAITEEQDIVYREDPPPGAPHPTAPEAPRDEDSRRQWTCDATVLFRYSALTFNGHRIHYDLDHARNVEGYPGLVVHGPLLATLLLEHLHIETAADQPRPPRSFEFRAVSPVFADQPFETCLRSENRTHSLWVRDSDGRLAMTATARV